MVSYVVHWSRVQKGCKKDAKGCKRGAIVVYFVTYPLTYKNNEGCKRGAKRVQKGVQKLRKRLTKGVQKGCNKGGATQRCSVSTLSYLTNLPVCIIDIRQPPNLVCKSASLQKCTLPA